MECTLQEFTAVPAPTQVSAVSVLAALCASDSMLMLVKSLLYTHMLVTFPVLSKENIDIMAASKHTCSTEAISYKRTMKLGISVGLSSC